MDHKNFKLFTSLLVLVLGAAGLQANPVFTANTAPFASSGPPCLVILAGGTSSSPIGAHIECADSNSGASGRASSATGIVGAAGSSFNNSGTSNPARSTADASYADTVVFHSSNPSDTSVVTSINLSASGALAEAHGGASVSFTSILNRTFEMAYTIELSDSGLDCHGTIAGGAPCSSTLTSAGLTGVPILVPLDTPVDFSLAISVFALSSEGFAGFEESARSEFGDTFQLPVGGPVFNLPAGFTANSASSLIVNNQFLPTTSAVPEPSMWPIGVLGVIALAWRGSRRGRSRSEC